MPSRGCYGTCVAFIAGCLAFPASAHAEWDLTIFLGRAFPTFDERLVLRPSIPSLPEVDVTVDRIPELRTDGGPVFGVALAVEAGVLGIEGRVDATDVGFDFTGARYELRATTPPFQGLAGSAELGDGRFDVERLYLLSLNLRLRTPGPVGLVASGGLSYLPEVSISGTVPTSIQIAGVPSLPILAPPLQLTAAPDESSHRFGVNGGAGLRIGGDRIALMAEARVFYFREYELRFGVGGAPAVIDDLLSSIDPVGFEPVIVNAQAGLVIRF